MDHFFLDEAGNKAWAIDLSDEGIQARPFGDSTKIQIRRMPIDSPAELPRLFGDRKVLAAAVGLVAHDADGRPAIQDTHLRRAIEDPAHDVRNVVRALADAMCQGVLTSYGDHQAVARIQAAASAYLNHGTGRPFTDLQNELAYQERLDRALDICY